MKHSQKGVIILLFNRINCAVQCSSVQCSLVQRVWPGPSRVSDSLVSAETVIYEAFVLFGEIGGWFSSLPSRRKGNMGRSLSG